MPPKRNTIQKSNLPILDSSEPPKPVESSLPPPVENLILPSQMRNSRPLTFSDVRERFFNSSNEVPPVPSDTVRLLSKDELPYSPSSVESSVTDPPVVPLVLPIIPPLQEDRVALLSRELGDLRAVQTNISNTVIENLAIQTSGFNRIEEQFATLTDVITSSQNQHRVEVTNMVSSVDRLLTGISQQFQNIQTQQSAVLSANQHMVEKLVTSVTQLISLNQ